MITNRDNIHEKNVIQIKMNINKKQVLASLKKNQQQLLLSLEHVLVILLDNSVSIAEARIYLEHQYPSTNADWTHFEYQTLEKLTELTNSFIQERREEWKQKRLQYESNNKYASQIKQTLLPELQLADNNDRKELMQLLALKRKEREELIKIHIHTQAEQTIKQTNTQIETLMTVLAQIEEYEQLMHLKEEINQSDRHYQTIIQKIVTQNRQQTNEVVLKEKQAGKKIVTDLMEEYQRKIIILKKRLYQIFLFYCRENKSVGLTFEDFRKTSEIIDLRLFLKYFKEFQFVEYNKYRFKVTSATQLFRNAASNGLSLTFLQFWNIHQKLFELKDLSLTRRDIIEAEVLQLEQFKLKLSQQMSKLAEFNQIVRQQKAKQLLNYVAAQQVKTKHTPEMSVKKSTSSVVLSSKVISNNSSQYFQDSIFSERESRLLANKNFIHRVRQEVNNAEEALFKSNKIERSNSLSTVSPALRKSNLEVALPKILNLSSKEIANQGIYKSLKRFSEIDYRNQQRKLRDLIGLSGEDDKYMSVFFKKELANKAQRVEQQLIARENKRKELKREISKQQSHCKKYNPDEVQPYMRF